MCSMLWPRRGARVDTGSHRDREEDGLSPPFSLHTGPPLSRPGRPCGYHPAAPGPRVPPSGETGICLLRLCMVTRLALDIQRRVSVRCVFAFLGSGALLRLLRRPQTPLLSLVNCYLMTACFWLCICHQVLSPMEDLFSVGGLSPLWSGWGSRAGRADQTGQG